MKITPVHVQKAYRALATGDKSIFHDYWTDDMAWFVPVLNVNYPELSFNIPGHNILSG